MTQQVEISLDTQCYLCESFLAQSQRPYTVYKCFRCMKCTYYCFSCELIMQKLFGQGNFFKCVHCNKLSNAIDKIEINPLNILNRPNQIQKVMPVNNNTFYKTPTKPFMENNVPISSIRSFNTNYAINQNNNNEEERKDNNNNANSNINANTNNNMLSNFINEFSMINLALNSNKNDIPQINQNHHYPNSYSNNINNNSINFNQNISNSNNNIQNNSNLANRTLTSSGSVSNFRKVNDFSLLRSKRRMNRKFCLNETFLGKKRDEYNMKSEFRGYNKSKDKMTIKNQEQNRRNIFGTTKPKKLISRNMSKVYNTENNINNYTKIEIEPNNVNVINNNKKDNFQLNNVFSNNNNSLGFALFNDNNMRSNLFNKNEMMHQKSNSTIIDGNVTPHRIYDNLDDQYF